MSEKFSDRIKAERIRLGFSVEDLAQKLGRSVSSQTKIESGLRNPTVHYLSRLLLLGIDIHYVITGKRVADGDILNKKVCQKDSLSERLKEERKRFKLNQTDFGLIGGIQKHAQMMYEKGKRYPKGEYLSLLDSAGVDVGYIITGNRDTYSESAQLFIKTFLSLDQKSQQSICNIMGLDLVDLKFYEADENESDESEPDEGE